jgi:murein hydrolase activator
MVRHTLTLSAMVATLLLVSAPHAQNLGVTEPAALDARDLAAVNDEIARLTVETQRLETEASTLGPRRDELRARARQQTRWLYHLTQGSALVLQGGPEMLLDHAARSERVRRLLHRTLRELESTSHRAETFESDRTRVATLLTTAQNHKREIVAAQQNAMAAMGARIGAPPPGSGPAVTVYGGAPAAAPVTEGFGASAGRLLFPVPGRAEARRTWREGADGPGIEIRCNAGTIVRSVYPGRVAFSDRYAAYGQIVIVDHGDHYYTVSANLGQTYVRVGQELAQGTPIGTAGDDGTGPMVFFEVRHSGETLDPAPWLGL